MRNGSLNVPTIMHTHACGPQGVGGLCLDLSALFPLLFLGRDFIRVFFCNVHGLASAILYTCIYFSRCVSLVSSFVGPCELGLFSLFFSLPLLNLRLYLAFFGFRLLDLLAYRGAGR